MPKSGLYKTRRQKVNIYIRTWMIAPRQKWHINVYNLTHEQARMNGVDIDITRHIMNAHIWMIRCGHNMT